MLKKIILEGKIVKGSIFVKGSGETAEGRFRLACMRSKNISKSKTPEFDFFNCSVTGSEANKLYEFPEGSTISIEGEPILEKPNFIFKAIVDEMFLIRFPEELKKE